MFDILQLNGTVLMDYPLHQRHSCLNQILKEKKGVLQIVQHQVASTTEALKAALEGAAERRCVRRASHSCA